MVPLGVLVYRIDLQDRLIAVGPGFDEFAAANEAPELSAATVLGRRLWSFIGDPETVLLYQALLARVRRTGLPISLPLRCDSPQWRRFMELDMVATSGAQEVEFRCALLRLEEQSPLALYDAHRAREGSPLHVCSWCKRVRLEGGWVEPEDAVRSLDLFAQPRLPPLSHGICDDCRQRVRATLARDEEPDQRSGL